MTTSRVAVFFYGSYMNEAVLAEVDIAPPGFEVARLQGFDIQIRPLANLVTAKGREVYGLLTSATEPELERLYAHARNVLGGMYLPENVHVECLDGARKPARCYIAPVLQERPATAAYVERILIPARQYGFPPWYIERLESFRP